MNFNQNYNMRNFTSVKPNILPIKSKSIEAITITKPKMKNLKRKANDDEESLDEDIDDNPLMDLLNQQHDDVYMNDNHIYFRTGVNKNSITKLTKLIYSANRKFDILQKTCKIAKIKPHDIFIHITTEGGDLIYGFLAYDVIRQSKIPINTVIEGHSCSAGTIISLAGKKRYASENSFMLIHQLSTNCGGNFEQLKDHHENNKLIMERIKKIYLSNTFMKKGELETLLKRDIYLDVKTCIKKGIVDDIYVE
jgi:ATP-dependent protease ClpP protease subunit